MTKTKEKLSFEEAMEGLEKSVNALNQEDTPMEAAIKEYEQGLAYFKRCDEILKEAKQKIQIFDKDTEEVKEF